MMKKLFKHIYIAIFIIAVFASTAIGITLEYTKEVNLAYADSAKLVYLTFDDGPSSYTAQILDILKANNIKATFFTVGTEIERHTQIFQRTYKEGHSIGVHCYWHNYKAIYENTQSFISDTLKCKQTIEKYLPDAEIKYMRMAGGSFGQDKAFIAEVSNLGFINVDWNAVNGDVENDINTPMQAANRAFSSAANRKKVVLLMHDNKELTLLSLPQIINNFRDAGYVFEKLR